MDRWRCIISSIPGGAGWRTLVESRAEQFRCQLKHPWDSLKLHRRQLPRQLQAGFLPFKQCPTGEGNQRRASCHSSVRNMSHVGTWKTTQGKIPPSWGQSCLRNRQGERLIHILFLLQLQKSVNALLLHWLE